MPTEKRQRQKMGQQARKEAALAAARRQQRKRKTITFVVIAAVVLAVMVLISTVGGDDDKTDVAAKGDKSSSSSTTTTEKASTTPTSAKPTVDVPDGPAPNELKTEDLKVGDGPEAKAGDTVEMNYVGVSYADGKQFDSSWDRGQTFSFTIGEGGVIKGWDEGIPGMKVGGRRQLVIPGSLAYGDQDTGDGRPHGALVFVVDLVAIK